MSSLRHVLRSLARAPGFTAVTMATLALGIGANAAVFSVVDAVLLQPLPYPESDRIVLLSGPGQAFVRFGGTKGFEVAPEELRESRAFASIGIAESGGLNLGAERPVRVRAAGVTPDFFPVLGVKPILGKVFTDGDLDESPRLAVLGHRLWQSRFGADPAIIGRTIRLNDISVLVTGVMPPRVEFPERTEIWVSARGRWQLEGGAQKPIVAARLAPGTSISHALDELIRIDDQPRPDRRLIPLREALVGHVRPVLSLIAWSAVFVLLVACINVTNLLLTRIAARDRDLSVRRLLGASRWRLVGHALSEGLMLSLAASVLALPVAIWTLDGIRVLLPQALHGAGDIAMNARALAGLSGFSVVTAVLVGLLPSLSIPERVSSYTRGTFAATVGPPERRIRSALVVVEVAIALVLLASSVTLMGTLAALTKTDLGARGDNALVVKLTLPRATYRSPERVWRFYESFITALRGIPGVAAVGVTDQLPGDPTKLPLANTINLDGRDATESRAYAIAACASPGYFEALGIQLLAGRPFTDSDGPGSSPVAVVSEGFVRALSLPPSEVIGRHTNMAGMMESREFREIVGVVRDVRYHGPQQSFSASVYRPCSERPPFFSPGHVILKVAFDPEILVPAVRRAAADLDSGLPLYNVRSFEAIRSDSLAEERLAMTLLSAFGGLAFALAILGLYGVISYLVQLRTREIGIRLAFGASPSRIKRDVLAAGLSHAAAGTVIGAASTLALSRLAWTRIAGLEQINVVNLLPLVVAVASVATVASWFPARRATKVDPVQSLRFE